MQWEWDGSDLERTALTCNMANGPTVWDLCLQVFAACFGLGFLRLMMWRLLKDQEELRNERRRARNAVDRRGARGAGGQPGRRRPVA